MEIVKIENLTKIYGKDEVEVKAHDHVSFSISKGEFLAIFGPSVPANQPCCIYLGG